MWGGQYKIQKTQGFATLLFTMVVLASITAFAFISASAVVTNQAAVKTYHQKQSAFNIAQAGLDYAIPYLDANYSTITNGSSQQINIPGGGYATLNFAFVGDKNTIQVTSTGYADGNSNSASVQQLVKYKSAENYKVFPQAVIARTRVTVSSGARIAGANVGDVIAVMGVPLSTSSYILMNLVDDTAVNTYWSLDGSGNYITTFYPAFNSEKGKFKSDVAYKPEIFSGKTNETIEQDLLGKTLSAFATISTDFSLPIKSTSTTYNAASFAPYTGYNSLTLTQKSSTIKVGSASGFTLGTADRPINLEINLQGTTAAAYLSGGTIYGDIIVHGTGSSALTIENNTKVIGNIIIEGGRLVVANNSSTSFEITGNIISAGNVTLNNSKVNGVIFSDDGVYVYQNSQVKGAIFCNSTLVTQNNSLIAHNSTYGKILTSGSANSGYARVAGSWTDL